MSTDENKFRKVEWDGDEFHTTDDEEMPFPLRPPSNGISADDLEMLTLAARAIGAQVDVVEGEEWVNLRLANGSTVWNWNPLVYKDNALDLSAELSIEIRYHLAGDVPGVTATCAADSRLPVPREPWGQDKAAAACRAITRAAAEIGKTLA